MSYSHADVGHAFARATKSLTGSRMSMHKPTVPKLLVDNQFDLLAYGVSYNTTVCKYIFNRNTQQHELWTTPVYHSPSTQRHLGYYRAGFMAKHSSDNIFTTPAGNGSSGSYISRTEKLFAQNVFSAVSNSLHEVDAPRLREATRRGIIASAIHRLDLATRNMTKGVSLDTIDADTLYSLQGTMHFIEMLMDTPDIDEVRAAVRAHMALNNLKNM